jgi:hypothetical protein
MKNIIMRFTICILIALTSLSSYSNEEYEFTEAERAQMLAPIALYPDSLLTHILIASTYPLEIVQAYRWQQENEYSRPALESQTWDPSIKALIPFPKIIEKLNTDLNWTQNLGDAFLNDEQSILASIQTLRHKAKLAGNLSQMDNVQISQTNDNIVIKTIQREVVYVPYYDTRVVYGNWHWSHHPPVYWHHANHYNYHQHNVFSWYPRVHISFNHFFTNFHWHNRHVIIRQKYPRNHHNVTIVKPKRWKHNPKHRHNVAYRSVKVNQKFKTHRTQVSQNKMVNKLANQKPYKKNVVINKHKTSFKANKHHNKKVTKSSSKHGKVIKHHNYKKTKVVKQISTRNNKTNSFKSSKVTVTKNKSHKSKSYKSTKSSVTKKNNQNSKKHQIKRNNQSNTGKTRREHY